MFTDDPVRDAERYSAEQERQLERLPKCSYCNNPIQQETVVCINDELLCDTCLTEYFRKDIDEYVN